MNSKPEVQVSFTESAERYQFPECKKHFSGWIDYDTKKGVLAKGLTDGDKAFYLNKRLELVFFNCMDRVYLRSAPCHEAVNGDEMSYFMIGTGQICNCIEALGSFVRGKEGGNDDNFKAFIKAYMPSWHVALKDGSALSTWLWKNLRNGIGHAFTIHRGGMEDLGSERFKEVRNGVVLVHTEPLYQDLRSGALAYFRDLDDSAKIELKENFRTRFDDLFIDRPAAASLV